MMTSIFETNDLYPGYDVPLKQHFSSYFNSVYICLSPFFIMSSGEANRDGLRRSEIISLEELQSIDKVFEALDPSVERVIYSNANFNYPGTDDIVTAGLPVTWNYIKENANFGSYSEINFALRTSIGALRSKYERKDLQKKLDIFTDKESIYNPGEGRITPLSLIKIYFCLKSLDKSEIVVTDEFFDNRFTINLNNLSVTEFIERTFGYMYYFPSDRSLLFTIEWDSFFYLIAGNKNLLNGIIKKFAFEGFYADDTTYHNWEFA